MDKRTFLKSILSAPLLYAATPSLASEGGQFTQKTTSAVGPHRFTALPGDRLTHRIKHWAESVGYRVIIEDDWNWTFHVPYESDMGLRATLDDVIHGFRTSARAPVVAIYRNNTLVIGAK